MLKPVFKIAALAGVLTALLSTAPASALVLHPSDPGVASTPSDAVIGYWNTNPATSSIDASVVAVSSQHVITTRHQNGSVALGSEITIDGTTYVAAQITNAPGSADLRVVRLETLGGQAAALTDFVEVYTGNQEVGQTLVIGGFGRGRGTDIIGGPGPNNGDVIGYNWSNNASKEQRWGANEITNTAVNTQIGSFTNDTLLATFEAPGDGVVGEATLAQADSGGGWFINDGGTWKVAALSQAVETEDINNPNQAIFNPEEDIFAIRLTGYSGFIASNVPEPGSAILLFAAIGLCARRRRD